MTNTPKNKIDMMAVIDIGSTSVRMLIAEVSRNNIKQIETLSQDTDLGRDTFRKGFISLETTEQCVSFLRGFRRVLSEYRIDRPECIRAVATSAVREAKNCESFIDRIYMATGIRVDVIDGTDVNRLTYFGLHKIFESTPELKDEKVLVVEVGGGSLELIALDCGKVSFSQTYRLGSFRLRERVENIATTPEEIIELFSAEISKTVRQIREYTGRRPGQKILALGADARFAAAILDKKWDKIGLAKVRIAAMRKLADTMLSSTEETLVHKYSLSFADAESIGPALLILSCLADELKVRSMMVGTTTLRDGILAEISSGGSWTRAFMKQLEHSVHQVGEKYDYNRRHAIFVKEISVRLFSQLRFEHKLSRHYEGILMVGSLLHDIGQFISNRSHHKHSQYLIENSDIFGLSERDISIAALVARYHRRSLPKDTHINYVKLDRDTRLTVNKLGAILRLADAIDYNRQFKASDFKIELKDNVVYFSVKTDRDVAAEMIFIKEKSLWFEQVYGHKVRLVTY